MAVVLGRRLGAKAVCRISSWETGGPGRRRLCFFVPWAKGEFCALYHFLGMGSGEAGVLIRSWDDGIHNQETKIRRDTERREEISTASRCDEPVR